MRGINVLQMVVAEAETIHHIRSVVFDHDIRFFDKRLDDSNRCGLS